MFMFAFISWNENNNGFDLVGLDFFFFPVVVVSQVPSSNSDDSFKNLP